MMQHALGPRTLARKPNCGAFQGSLRPTPDRAADHAADGAEV